MIDMKKILLLGLGKSGISAAKMLCGEAQVSCWDSKAEDDFNPDLLEELRAKGIELYFGEDAQVSEDYDECIISPGIRTNHPMVSHAKALKGELELAYENCKGSFVAITGSNGKTTTTTLVGKLLDNVDAKNIVAGNIGVPVCDSARAAEEDTVMVTEVSSFQLETIKDFHPHIAAILNLAPDHLDRHGTAEEYYRCKCRVFENQTDNDFLVYNMDDEETVKHIETCKAFKVPFTRLKPAIALSMENNIAFVNEGIITVRVNGKDTEVVNVDELQVPGNHNIENILAACMIAALAGVKPKSMAKVLKGFKGVEHRMEYVREFKGVKYINDSKGTNPDSSIRALQAIETPIILIAGGYEKNSDFTDFVKAFDGKVRYLVLLGKTAERLAQAARDGGFNDADIIKCSSLEACVASAAKLSEKGDTVLLSPACASWDMFESFEQRGDMFKQIVKSLT